MKQLRTTFTKYLATLLYFSECGIVVESPSWRKARILSYFFINVSFVVVVAAVAEPDGAALVVISADESVAVVVDVADGLWLSRRENKNKINFMQSQWEKKFLEKTNSEMPTRVFVTF